MTLKSGCFQNGNNHKGGIMKTIMIPIQPKHNVNIEKGLKTDELRKVVPNIPVPFKVCTYETLNGGGRGKVVNEWICDEIKGFDFKAKIILSTKTPIKWHFNKEDICKSACVTEKEFNFYFKNEDSGFALHISELKIYDKPKALGEFYAYNKELEKRFIDGDGFCCYDGKDGNGEPLTDCSGDNLQNCYKCWEEWSGWCKRITKPPQNFVYIREGEND